MDDLDYIEFDHAVNSGDPDYLESLEESAGQDSIRPYIGGGMSKICKVCGTSSLYWYRDSKNKWRLEDKNGVPHTCNKN
jgi:hypothetical protein